MKKINELALPTLGTTGTTGTVGTNPVTAGSPVAIGNAIANLNKIIQAAGNTVDPTVKQTLANLQKAYVVASQKAVKQAQDAAKQAQQAAATTAQPKPPGQADEEIEDRSINNSMAKKKLSPAQKKVQQKLAAKAAPTNKVTKADFEALKKESTDFDINNFLKAISQKNYAQADKYLQSAVDSRLKASINKAVENSK
jgi:hypothetical protein